MNEKNIPMDNNSRSKEDKHQPIEENSLTTFTFTDPNAIMKSLMTPRFLGSTHIKQGLKSNNVVNLENLMQNKLQMKLKGAVYNPITLTLIIIALAFNLMWLFFLLFA